MVATVGWHWLLRRNLPRVQVCGWVGEAHHGWEEWWMTNGGRLTTAARHALPAELTEPVRPCSHHQQSSTCLRDSQCPLDPRTLRCSSSTAADSCCRHGHVCRTGARESPGCVAYCSLYSYRVLSMPRPAWRFAYLPSILKM